MIILLTASCAAIPASARERLIAPATNAANAVSQTDIGLRSGSVVVAPIPFTNETIGNGLALGAGYLFTLPGSKPSGFGIGYLETDAGSTGYALGGSVNFGEGRWTLGALYGEAELRYDLPLELPLLGTVDFPLYETGTAGGIQLGYGFTDNFSVAFTLGYLDTDISIDSNFISKLPDFLRPDLNVELRRLTFDLKFDTRDDTFYPSEGIVASASLTHAAEVDSLFDRHIDIGDRDYFKTSASLSGYRAVGEDGVLAANASACAVGDDAPFFDQCGVGHSDSLRGFASLENLASHSVAAQVEYRGRLSPRWGYVAFVGGGAGGDSFSDLSSDRGGAAAGVGLRFRLSRQFKLDYAADWAMNDQGDHQLYLTLGQRF